MSNAGTVPASKSVVVVQQPARRGINVGLLSSVSAIAVIGYVGAVMWNGNLEALGAQLYADWHFLEFVAALGLLYLVARADYLSGPASALIAVAAVGLAIKTLSNEAVQSNLNGMLQGQVGLFKGFAGVFSGVGQALHIKPQGSGL